MEEATKAKAQIKDSLNKTNNNSPIKINKKYKHDKQKKLIFKSRGSTKTSSALKKIKSIRQRVKTFWEGWVSFRGPIPMGPKPKEVDKTFGIPGYEEICCIQAEIPDIMIMDPDKIRTSCKEYNDNPPTFPTKSQIKSKLIEADKYYNVQPNRIQVDKHSKDQVKLIHEADYYDEDGFCVRPSWRYIIERPLVEQYVLMKNYVRKVSILSEFNNRNKPKEYIEEEDSLSDSEYDDFLKRHKSATDKLISSIRMPNLHEMGVQTNPVKYSFSESSFYPDSEISKESVKTKNVSTVTVMTSGDVSSTPTSDFETKKSQVKSDANWWDSKECPFTSESFATPCSSFNKNTSESASDGLSIPVHSAAAMTSLVNPLTPTKTYLQEKPTRKKVTFSDVVKYYQTPETNLSIYSIPPSLDMLDNEPTDEKKDNQMTDMHQVTSRCAQNANINIESINSCSTSDEHIKLKASPAVLFKPGLLCPPLSNYPTESFYPEVPEFKENITTVKSFRPHIKRDNVTEKNLLTPNSKILNKMEIVENVHPDNVIIKKKVTKKELPKIEKGNCRGTNPDEIQKGSDGMKPVTNRRINFDSEPPAKYDVSSGKKPKRLSYHPEVNERSDIEIDITNMCMDNSATGSPGNLSGYPETTKDNIKPSVVNDILPSPNITKTIPNQGYHCPSTALNEPKNIGTLPKFGIIPPKKMSLPSLMEEIPFIERKLSQGKLIDMPQIARSIEELKNIFEKKCTPSENHNVNRIRNLESKILKKQDLKLEENADCYSPLTTEDKEMKAQSEIIEDATASTCELSNKIMENNEGARGNFVAPNMNDKDNENMMGVIIKSQIFSPSLLCVTPLEEQITEDGANKTTQNTVGENTQNYPYNKISETISPNMEILQHKCEFETVQSPSFPVEMTTLQFSVAGCIQYAIRKDVRYDYESQTVSSEISQSTGIINTQPELQEKGTELLMKPLDILKLDYPIAHKNQNSELQRDTNHDKQKVLDGLPIINVETPISDRTDTSSFGQDHTKITDRDTLTTVRENESNPTTATRNYNSNILNEELSLKKPMHPSLAVLFHGKISEPENGARNQNKSPIDNTSTADEKISDSIRKRSASMAVNKLVMGVFPNGEIVKENTVTNKIASLVIEQTLGNGIPTSLNSTTQVNAVHSIQSPLSKLSHVKAIDRNHQIPVASSIDRENPGVIKKQTASPKKVASKSPDKLKQTHAKTSGVRLLTLFRNKKERNDQKRETIIPTISTNPGQKVVQHSQCARTQPNQITSTILTDTINQSPAITETTIK